MGNATNSSEVKEKIEEHKPRGSGIFNSMLQKLDSSLLLRAQTTPNALISTSKQLTSSKTCLHTYNMIPTFLSTDSTKTA